MYCVNYRGQEVDAIEVLSCFQGGFQKFISALRRGMDEQKAFDLVMSISYKKKKDAKWNAKEEIAALDSSISTFASLFKIEESVLRKMLYQFPKDSLTEILNRYLKTPQSFNKYSHTIYGVACRAICTQYRLNHRVFCKYKSHGASFQEAIHNAIITSPLFSKDVSNTLKTLFPNFTSITVENIEKVSSQFSINDNFISEIIVLYYLHAKVQDALNAYCIIDYIENSWYILNKKTAYNKESLEQFNNHSKLLKEKTRQYILDQYHLTKQDLEEIYNKFYYNYTEKEINFEKVWTYNRQRTKSLQTLINS